MQFDFFTTIQQDFCRKVVEKKWNKYIDYGFKKSPDSIHDASAGSGKL